MGRVACVVFLFAGVEFLDLARLAAAQRVGEYNVDPETLRDALRCALIVAGEHGDVDAATRSAPGVSIVPADPQMSELGSLSDISGRKSPSFGLFAIRR